MCVALTATVIAQTTVHPGKVQIRSTAADALQVLGGAGIGVGTAAPANNLEVRSSVDGVSSGGVRISRADGSYLILNMDDGGASAYGTLQAGDGSAFRPIRMSPSGGGVHLANGTVAAPSLAFINEPTSGFYWDNLSSGGFNVAVGSAKAARFSQAGIEVPAEARGTGGVAGKAVVIGRNSSGSGAPGQIALEYRNGAGSAFIWGDTSGVMRVGTSAVTEVGGDTGGTVIGTQTSTAASKHVLAQVSGPVATSAALSIIRDTPVYQFIYKNGAYNGETFYGITTDSSPLFGMDQGKSFNPVTSFGVTVLAMQALDAKVRDLEARLRVLEGRR